MATTRLKEWLKDEESLPNIYRFKKITDRLSNKHFLSWLLTPRHLKYVATLPCNLSLIASFLTLLFYKVVWQHMQRVVGLLIIVPLLQIYYVILQ